MAEGAEDHSPRESGRASSWRPAGTEHRAPHVVELDPWPTPAPPPDDRHEAVLGDRVPSAPPRRLNDVSTNLDQGVPHPDSSGVAEPPHRLLGTSRPLLQRRVTVVADATGRLDRPSSISPPADHPPEALPGTLPPSGDDHRAEAALDVHG